MISQSAIQEFLLKPRDSLVWIKTIPEEVLDEEIAKLRPKPFFLPALRKHQKACLLLGIAYPELFFQLEMGTGKSLLTLVLQCYFTQLGKKKHLVYVPMDEAIDSWLDEIAKWKVPLRGIPLRDNSEAKIDTWHSFDEGVAIGTYTGVGIALSDLIHKVDKKKPKSDKREWTLNKDRVKQFRESLDTITFDESTKIAHKNTLSFDAANQLSLGASVRYALAGRAFGRDPLDLWAQFYLVDRGQTLGPTLALFREALFSKTRSRWGGPYSFNYKLDPKKRDDLIRISGHRAIHYSADECIDLPPVSHITKRVSLPEDASVYYQRFVQDIIASKGNLSAVKNLFLQMRQTSSGFLGFKDDEDGERITLEFPHNPKFNLLMDLIEEIPEDQKALIFYEFTHSGRKIHEALNKLGYKNGWLWGQTKDWASIKHKFDNQPDYRFLVIQSKKGSYNLNLQAANIEFFYESPVPAIDRDQAERRTIRQGQTKKVRIFDLVTRDTMDEKILRYHKEGGDLFRDLVVNPSQLV